MKKLIFIGLITCGPLFANNCDILLKEADKYLQRVPLCDVTSEKHANIALAYYKRYEICRYEYEKAGTKFKTDIATSFKINPLDDDNESFECQKHKN
ncbi:hypothetical protein ACOTVS_09810 [Aliarcobacter butzleri]|uniref:hypothetical protein n=1 Tax=Aliarcobacter butzleri TaxID=28197 RepID=UPI00344ED307